MPKRSSKDPNVNAFSIMQRVTSGDAPASDMSAALNDTALRKRLMQEMGRRGGKKGGKARAETLTKTRRTEIAKAAAQSRWASVKKAKQK